MHARGARSPFLAFVLFVSLWLSPSRSSAAHVQFNFADFITATSPLTNRTLYLIPTNSTPLANGTYVITSDRRAYQTDNNGSVTISNMVAMNYLGVLRGPYRDTAITFTVPETNILLNANELIAITADTTFATDARYVARASGASTNQILHGLRYAKTNIAGTTSVLPLGFGVVLVESTTNLNLNLPASSFIGAGRWYSFKNLSTNTVTLTAASGDIIEGAASVTLTNKYDRVDLLMHGTNWLKY